MRCHSSRRSLDYRMLCMMVYRVNYSLSETRQIQERLEMTRCLQPAPQLCNAWIDCSPVVEFCVQKTRLWHHQQPRLAVSHSWCIFVACSKRPRIFSPVQVVVMLLLRKKYTWKKKPLVDHWRDWTIIHIVNWQQGYYKAERYLEGCWPRRSTQNPVYNSHCLRCT